MSNYLALARKYRPQSFDDVVGQSNILTAIKNSLDNGKLHHAYLLTGTRGVGKTTLARLFAKSLNCEKGVSSSPCGCCEACRAIENGNFIDLVEIDAASKTKVEDTRVLLDNVAYKPVAGRYKIYIIDEVHMLSKSSFNALLKTLEEPPEYVKFILATTDPQNIPPTIVSRCLQFKLKNLTTSVITEKLTSIFEKEQISAEMRAVQVIATAANGSMRDALSIADQAIALTNGHITADETIKMLGVVDSEIYRQLLTVVVQKNYASLYELLERVDSFSPNYDSMINELAGFIHEIAMFQALGENVSINFRHSVETLRSFANSLSQDVLQTYYQILLIGRKEMPYAPAGRVCFDMTMLRMISFVDSTAIPQVRTIATVQQQQVQEKPNFQPFVYAENSDQKVVDSVESNSIPQVVGTVPNNFALGNQNVQPMPVPQSQVTSSSKATSSLYNRVDSPLSRTISGTTSKQEELDSKGQESIAELMNSLNGMRDSVNFASEANVPWDVNKPKIPLPVKGEPIVIPPMNSDSDEKKNIELENEQNINNFSTPLSQDIKVLDTQTNEMSNNSVVTEQELNSQPDLSTNQELEVRETNNDQSSHNNEIVSAGIRPLELLDSNGESDIPSYEEPGFAVESNALDDIPSADDEFYEGEYSDASVMINYEDIVSPQSNIQPIEKGRNSKMMFDFAGELPFSDPDEYLKEHAIEYVDDPWWNLIKETITDQFLILILKSTYMLKTENAMEVHIDQSNMLLLTDEFKKQIMESMAPKEPLAKKIQYVIDSDTYLKSPNGLVEYKYRKIKNQMMRKLVADQRFVKFTQAFGLQPDIENLHLIRKDVNKNEK